MPTDTPWTVTLHCSRRVPPNSLGLGNEPGGRPSDRHVRLGAQISDGDIGEAGARTVSIKVQVVLAQHVRRDAPRQLAIQIFDHDLPLNHQFGMVQIQNVNRLARFLRMITGNLAR